MSGLRGSGKRLIRDGIRLEKERLTTGVSWYEQKAVITRGATTAFLIVGV